MTRTEKLLARNRRVQVEYVRRRVVEDLPDPENFARLRRIEPKSHWDETKANGRPPRPAGSWVVASLSHPGLGQDGHMTGIKPTRNDR